ncbi:complex I NDUFA9 subunit family protein [Maritimibacter sp. 55A14]|nr:complex I NDUFA9 subunit family protein [Maritimibacter sp. 55A14]
MAPKASKDTIVFGGTGFLGNRVVRDLRNHGFRVGIATRFPQKAVQFADGNDHGTRLIRIDLRDHDSLRRAVEGASAVINCIGFYIETRTELFRDVHVDGARAIAAAAKTQGLRDLIHLSGIGADPRSPSAYIRARAEGEEEVRRAFPAATILRPSVMFSRDGAFFGDLDAIIRNLPVVPLFGDGRTRLQPVHVGDVAKAIRRALELGDARGRVFELGGPDCFTYRDILQRLAARANRRRLLLPLPFAFWWALAAGASLLPRPPLTPAQVALMQHDNVVGDGVATFADLSIAPRSATELGLL